MNSEESDHQFLFDSRDCLQFVLVHAFGKSLGYVFDYGANFLIAFMGPVLIVASNSFVINFLIFSIAVWILHQCEWLVLRRRLPVRSHSWYLWPFLNLLGIIFGTGISRLIGLTMPTGAPGDHSIGWFVLAHACVLDIGYGVIVASIPAYWLYKTVSANAWYFVAMRAITSGIYPLFNFVTLVLVIYVMTGRFTSPSIGDLWSMSYHLSNIFLIFLLQVGFSVLSGALVAAGLWMMARSAEHKLQLGRKALD
jgi:hypothetical protein